MIGCPRLLFVVLRCARLLLDVDERCLRSLVVGGCSLFVAHGLLIVSCSLLIVATCYLLVVCLLLVVVGWRLVVGGCWL